ncbi:GNAT family N-acetyltransferase [Vibrio makurazakiensis]|uniref:GNAT family N-acetyltransferase n=1 Tax=Vibrio makurazakiensis TaxID=2910250 RepID=UPI003D0EF8E5
MNLALEVLSPEDSERRFEVVKQGLISHVERVFGWDDGFQRDRLDNDYQADWFHWIKLDEQEVGLVCFKPYESAYHIHLLIVRPEFQSLGIGLQVMSYLHRRAKRESKTHITLSSFIDNHGAISFYQKLGYQITESEENFVTMSVKL